MGYTVNVWRTKFKENNVRDVRTKIWTLNTTPTCVNYVYELYEKPRLLSLAREQFNRTFNLLDDRDVDGDELHFML